jgi:hypothetical protein
MVPRCSLVSRYWNYRRRSHDGVMMYLEAFSRLKISLLTPGGAPDLEPRADIWPTDLASIIRVYQEDAAPGLALCHRPARQFG